MSVYTTVSHAELQAYLENYDLGALVSHKGISAGIENTNYFVTTEKTDDVEAGASPQAEKWVLTLFEKHSKEELLFFMKLMMHLDANGVATAKPLVQKNGNVLGTLNGKPALLVTCLAGKTLDGQQPSVKQCAEIGKALAEFHVMSASFDGVRTNERGEAWRYETGNRMLPFLHGDDGRLLQQELNDQQAFQAMTAWKALPCGTIHADLFRDNAMFEGEQLSGIIDWYYAATDRLLFDLATVTNDWCFTADNRHIDTEKLQAFLAAYHQVKPLSDNDLTCWQGMLRASALRFWLSRLCDYHSPREGELTKIKDPNECKNKLIVHIHSEALLRDCWTKAVMMDHTEVLDAAT